MKKILVAVAAILLCMLVLPLIILRSVEGWDAMGYLVLFFLILYPVLAVALGILAGTELQRLWWLPVGSALLFPPFFWLAIAQVVWELYLYAAIYLGLSAVSAAPTALIKYAVELKRK